MVDMVFISLWILGDFEEPLINVGVNTLQGYPMNMGYLRSNYSKCSS